MESLNKRRPRRFGDRYDGYRLSSVDPFFLLIPHIMPTRNDSMVCFEEEVEITELERFVRRMRRESDMKDLSMIQVIMAAAVRMIALKPAVNRFVAGRRIFARNSIHLSIAVKKEMSLEGEETTIKPEFFPTDTLHDVWSKLHAEFAANKDRSESNSTDIIAKIFSYLPTFITKFAVFTLKNFDKIGLLPRFINEFSPFHTSAFIVDNGSLGIDSVFHHIYNFGTCSIFLSIGRKRTEYKIQSDGSIKATKLMTLRFVVDERICDGFYYATTIRSLRKIIRNPEILLDPPEELPEDPALPPLKNKKPRRIRRVKAKIVSFFSRGSSRDRRKAA